MRQSWRNVRAELWRKKVRRETEGEKVDTGDSAGKGSKVWNGRKSEELQRGGQMGANGREELWMAR